MSGSGKSCVISSADQAAITSARIYKIPDGKGENAFAFSGEAKNKKYATEIIHECNEAWRRLISGDSPAKTPSYEISMCVASCFFLIAKY
jgi:hypothetical protein